MLKQVFYKTPPAGFFPSMEVVACYIKHQDKILFLKRHPLKTEGNTWCVPGEKRDAGESLIGSMQREIKEETSLELSQDILQHAGVTYMRYPTFDFTYHLFRADIDRAPSIQLNIEEHLDYCWMTLSEANTLSLTPGIKEALNILFNKELAKTTE